MVRRIKMFVLRALMFVYGFIYKTEKKVLFTSFGGTQYSDSPRAISEKLHELYPDYKIIWYLTDPCRAKELLPDYVRIAKVSRYGPIKDIASSFCYINNNANTRSIYKKKNQFFIQTWHGDRGFKKILYEAGLKSEHGNPPSDEYISDLCIAASDFGEDVFRKAFRYNGEILKIGMPRNDKLVRQDKKEISRIRKSLNIAYDKNILLYAPTYREYNRGVQGINVNIDQTLHALEKKGGSWVCIVRAHPNIDGLRAGYDGTRVIDVSDYPDMADLLLVADMLITDYSSSSGDYVIQNKPIIMADFDKKEYMDTRTFRCTPEEAGYIVVYDQEELNEKIVSLTNEQIMDSCRKVRDFYGITECGNSAEKICHRIDEEYNKRFKR